MADITKTLEIIFNGIDKGVAGTVDGITGKMTGLGAAFGAMDNIAEPFGKMADKVIAADMALGALTVGGLVLAYSQFKDMASAVAELDKVLGDNTEGLIAAKKNAYELSQTYGTAMTEIIGSTANFVQAGFSVEEAMKLVKNSMDLSIAGSVSAAEASEKLVAILKGFNAPASDAGRILDILNEVSNKYATNVKELADGMALVSPIAKLMGFTFEETAGLLTPIIEVFRSGTMSAEGLKTGLLKLTDDSKPVVDALMSIGISQKNANGELKSGKEILGEVANKYSGLSDAQKLFLTQQLVGMDQAPKMAIVFDQYGKVINITKDAMNSAGSAAKEVAKQLETPQKQIDILIVSFKNLAEAVGEKFGESATEAIKASNEIGLALQKALGDGAFDSVLKVIDDLFKSIAEFLRDFAKSLPEALQGADFTPLVSALQSLGGAVKAFFGDFDPKDPEKVRAAIQKVVDGLALLVNTTKGMADTFAPIIGQIIKSIEDLSKASTEDQELFGNILAAGKLVMDMSSQVVLALAAMHEWGVNAKDVFEVLGGSVKVVFNSLQVMFDAFVITFLEGLIRLNKAAELVTFGNLGEEVKATTKSLEAWRDAVGKDYEAQLKDIDGGLRMIGEGFGIVDKAATTSGNTMADFRKKLDDLAKNSNTTVEIEITAKGKDAEEVMSRIEKRTEELEKNPVQIDIGYNPEYYADAMALVDGFKAASDLEITTRVNEDAAKESDKILKEIIGYTDEGKPLYFFTSVDEGSLKKTKKNLKEEIPTEKQIEIKLQGQIDKEMEEIRAKGAAASAAFEWRAKLRIEEAKADAERLIETTKVLGTQITSIGEDITKMFDVKFDDMPMSVYMIYVDSLKQKNELQKQSFELEKKVMEQQVKYMELRNKALQSGEALIKIDSTGLEPALESILWQIIQKVQLKANEDSAAFLLGIK